MQSCAISSGMNKHSKTRRCAICGVEYEICVSCEKTNSWKVHTDTATHYEYLCILMDYKVKRDAEKAYKALTERGFDFNEADSFLPGAKALAEEIFFAVNINEEEVFDTEEDYVETDEYQLDEEPDYL